MLHILPQTISHANDSHGLQGIGLLQYPQRAANQVQAPGDERLHRLAFRKPLAKLPRVVDGLLDRRHDLNGGIWVYR